MSHIWPILSVILLVGCVQETPAEVESPPPSRADTNFDRLSLALAGIQASEVLLYEGLPSQFWEPQLREEAMRTQQTIEIHGYPFFEELLTLEEGDSEKLTALFSERGSFQKYRGDKQCSGYHPDYCLEWKSGDGPTHALISLECGEVEIFGPQGELHCDFREVVAQNLRQLLGHYSNKRPKTEENP